MSSPKIIRLVNESIGYGFPKFKTWVGLARGQRSLSTQGKMLYFCLIIFGFTLRPKPLILQNIVGKCGQSLSWQLKFVALEE